MNDRKDPNQLLDHDGSHARRWSKVTLIGTASRSENFEAVFSFCNLTPTAVRVVRTNRTKESVDECVT
jgi:hypothetical protein